MIAFSDALARIINVEKFQEGGDWYNHLTFLRQRKMLYL